MRTDAVVKISSVCLGLWVHVSVQAQTIIQDSFTGCRCGADLDRDRQWRLSMHDGRQQYWLHPRVLRYQ